MADNQIPWTDKMSVGIDVLDNDHKTLIALLNSFIQAVDNDEGVMEFDCTFRMFMDYASEHFAREEALMEKAGYEGLEAHIRGHRILTEQLIEMHNKVLMSASAELQDDVREFLTEWLSIHIMVKDQGYSGAVKAYLNAQAPQQAIR